MNRRSFLAALCAVPVAAVGAARALKPNPWEPYRTANCGSISLVELQRFSRHGMFADDTDGTIAGTYGAIQRDVNPWQWSGCEFPRRP